MAWYSMIPFGLGVILFILGIFVFLFPVKATKKSQRDNRLEVAKVKKSGIIYMVIAVLVIVVSFSLLQKEVKCSWCKDNWVSVSIFSDPEMIWCDECLKKY